MKQQPRDRKVTDPHPGAIKRSIQRKVKSLYLLFALLAVLIIGQIILIQWGPNSSGFKNLAKARFYTTSIIEGNKGNIYDRNGKLLLTDAQGYRLRLDLHAPKLYDADSVYARKLPILCDSLAAMFGGKPSTYKRYLDSIQVIALSDTARSRYSQPFPVNRVFDQFEYERICSFPMMNRQHGLITSTEAVRHKTHGALASYTISRCIEQDYATTLNGTDGQSRFVWLNASHSRKKPVIDRNNRPATNGSDIITTIDIDLQDVVDGSLRRQIEREGATFGTAVVVECATGEIRAMSNLTRYSGGSINDNLNYAIRWQGDPGSTFKGVSLMALIEEGNVSISRTINCGKNKTVDIDGAKVTDTHIVGNGSGVTTLKGAFAESSNIGFATVVTETFKDNNRKEYPNYRRWMEYINSLGLDKVRNIQNISGYGFRGIKAPGYAKGSSWSPKTLANNAYGYELTMTPMQTLMFYNAVANGGRLVAPMLIKQVVREGVVIEEAAPTIINPTICSQATLGKVQECMEAVVTYKYGTANTLKDLPFKVAGKTGTAQVVQPKEKWGKDKNGKPNAYITLDGSREYVATFVGYFPADNPKYSCIVMMNTFQRADESNKKIYGSNLAMPVFREISEYIYSHDPEWFNTATRRAVAPQQSKAIGAPATREGTVPNVKGMGLRDALYELEKAGLKVSFKGQGAVVEQSVKPGSPIEAGMEVSLTLGSQKSNNK